MSNPDDWAFYDQQAAQELLDMQRQYSEAADAQRCIDCGGSRMVGDVKCEHCRMLGDTRAERVAKLQGKGRR